jgi:hypothetical protein
MGAEKTKRKASSEEDQEIQSAAAMQLCTGCISKRPRRSRAKKACQQHDDWPRQCHDNTGRDVQEFKAEAIPAMSSTCILWLIFVS